ncbi:MAG: MFS transporter [Vicinamibacterales bacterium]
MRDVTDAGAGAWVDARPRGRFYYGWVVLGVAALAMVGTLPGRTQGLGLITEPLLRDLGINRVTFAQVNLVATLVGSIFCFGVGRLIDRRGSRVVLTAISLALGLTVLVMSRATGLMAILVLVTLTRGFGQSALSVVSLAMVGKWFRRRLTRAMAIYAVIMSVGFMAAFPIVGAAVLASGWRATWAVIGACLTAGLAPLAWLLVRSDPETIGLGVDGDTSPQPSDDSRAQATLVEALRSPAFWVFALASSLYGLVASGIGLFNESILAERGFAPAIYHRALAITALTGLAGNLAAGAYSGHGSLRRVLVAALVILGLALAGLARVTTVAHVFVQAVAMGIAGGFVMVVFFSFWGQAYGRAHLGRIQGAAQAMTVLASAVGPLMLALSVEATGSYATAFYTLAGGVSALGAAAAIVPMPRGCA